MRFAVMHKTTDEMERGLPPDQATIDGVGRLIQEGLKDKVFVSGEGLKPSSYRVHVTYAGGKRTAKSGPFVGATQLPAGFALMKVRSKDEALAWCDRFAALLGDVELYLGAVVEPWDLGMMPRPEHAPLRFLSMHEADVRSESDAPPDPRLMAKMGDLIGEMTKAGALQATGGFASTRAGARLRFEGGKHTIVDGPFAESKELVGGYSILDLPSKAAAIEWAIRFAKVVAVAEIDVRQMPEW